MSTLQQHEGHGSAVTNQDVSRTRRQWISMLVAVAVLVGASPALAGMFADKGVRTNPITICFVGDAVTNEADRVNQIIDSLSLYEQAANVRFQYLGKCPASVPQPNGNDWFGGDIRVLIPGAGISTDTAMVPGIGCTQDNPDSSWSNFPSDLATNRPCLYNAKIFNDAPCDVGCTPYTNHALHELGHALGLQHEHERADATCYPGPGTDTRYLTPYDRDSLMHYLSQGKAGEPTPPNECPDVLGNYDYDGPSTWDKLSLRLLYPENSMKAPIRGTSVVRLGETLHLWLGWAEEGAYIPYVAPTIEWRVNGTLVGSAADFTMTMPAGSPITFDVQLTVIDFLGRTYTGWRTVQYVNDAQMKALLGAASATMDLVLDSIDQIFLDGFESGSVASWSSHVP